MMPKIEVSDDTARLGAKVECPHCQNDIDPYLLKTGQKLWYDGSFRFENKFNDKIAFACPKCGNREYFYKYNLFQGHVWMDKSFLSKLRSIEIEEAHIRKPNGVE